MEVDAFHSPLSSPLQADTATDLQQGSVVSTPQSSCSQEKDYLSIPAPKKRSRFQDDPFFQEGNYEYKAAWLRLENEEAYIPNSTGEYATTDIDTIGDDSPERSWAPQVCQLGLCQGKHVFSSPIAYEHHYEIHHRHICRTCHKSFPGERWLRLHLNEIHDVLIKIRRERGERTYQCFVDDCDRLCSTPDKRKRHLIDKHKYPKHFNFEIVRTGVLPVAVRLRHAQREKALRTSREQNRQKVHQEQSKPPHLHTTISQDMDMDTNSASHQSTLQQQHKGTKGGPSSRPIIGNASSTPRPMFQQYRHPSNELSTLKKTPKSPFPEPLHDSDTEQDHNVNKIQDNMIQQQDMEIDQLQNSMAKLMVPRSVSNRMRNTKK